MIYIQHPRFSTFPFIYKFINLQIIKLLISYLFKIQYKFHSKFSILILAF